MIPRRNLSLLSNRLARNGSRRIPEAVLERDYCLSWFLVGLSRTPLTDNLAFKGGTAIKKCYVPEYRFSEDLDFTRSVVQIYPPLPVKSRGCDSVAIPFSFCGPIAGQKTKSSVLLAAPLWTSGIR